MAPARPEHEGRILVVDDEPDVALLLEQLLRTEGFKVHSVPDGEAALRAVLDLHPDLVLLDVMLPGIDGYEVVSRLRSDPRTADVLVIMLTAGAQKADVILGLTTGADDHVTKPFDTNELVARVRGALRRDRRLRALSPLTGLPGNILIQQRMHDLVAAGGMFGLLYVDLDNFKAYNDHYGFVRGDEVIQAVARLLQDVVNGPGGPGGFVGHIGGDDFVVLVPQEAAEPVAAEVVRRFDQAVPALYDLVDAEAGAIDVPDRQGAPQRFPLLTVSIGGATTERRRFRHQGEAVASATDMKGVAKRRHGSSYAFDRRASDPPPGEDPRTAASAREAAGSGEERD